MVTDPSRLSASSLAPTVFRQASGQPFRAIEDSFGEVGFTVSSILSSATTDGFGTRVARPILSRTATRRAGHPLRWAIKTGVPEGVDGDVWGDLFFARDIAAALEALGHEVIIDRLATATRDQSDYLDDVCVTIRGLHAIPPNPAAINVLWVISHPDLVSDEELGRYDLVFAASSTWAAERTRPERPVLELLQATNPGRFSPGGADPTLRSDVLFVGNSRDIFRPIVRDAIAAGADITIYGGGWEPFVDERAIAATSLDNDSLPSAYRSARIVLNDHWDDMRDSGFISNRIFDAVASGARVVTDPVDGISEIFGDAVTTYSNEEELKAILTGDARGADDARLRAAQHIAAEHSFQRRAEVLVASVLTQLNVGRAPVA
jgi:hypothetical protein